MRTPSTGRHLRLLAVASAGLLTRRRRGRCSGRAGSVRSARSPSAGARRRASGGMSSGERLGSDSLCANHGRGARGDAVDRLGVEPGAPEARIRRGGVTADAHRAEDLGRGVFPRGRKPTAVATSAPMNEAATSKASSAACRRRKAARSARTSARRSASTTSGRVVGNREPAIARDSRRCRSQVGLVPVWKRSHNDLARLESDLLVGIVGGTIGAGANQPCSASATNLTKSFPLFAACSSGHGHAGVAARGALDRAQEVQPVGGDDDLPGAAVRAADSGRALRSSPPRKSLQCIQGSNTCRIRSCLCVPGAEGQVARHAIERRVFEVTVGVERPVGPAALDLLGQQVLGRAARCGCRPARSEAGRSCIRRWRDRAPPARPAARRA